jgi:hypothetical protein
MPPKRAPIVEAKRTSGGGYLSPADTLALLDAYGFPTVGQAVVPLNGDLAAAAKQLSFPPYSKWWARKSCTSPTWAA